MTALATQTVFVDEPPVVGGAGNPHVRVGMATATSAGLEIDVMVANAMLPAWTGFRHPAVGNPMVNAVLSTTWLDFASELYGQERRMTRAESDEIDSIIDGIAVTASRRRGEQRR